MSTIPALIVWRITAIDAWRFAAQFATGAGVVAPDRWPVAARSSSEKVVRLVGVRRGFSLAELVLVVAMLGILAAVTIPRLPHEVIGRKRCEVSAAKMAGHLRWTRQLAITNAAANPTGFRLEMTGDAPYEAYRIVNAETAEVVASESINEGVLCTGTNTIAFNPLGALIEGRAQLEFSAEGKTVALSVVAATGTVIYE